MNILDQKRFDKNTMVMRQQSQRMQELEEALKESQEILAEQKERLKAKEMYEEQQSVQNSALRQRIRDQTKEIEQLQHHMTLKHNETEPMLGTTATTTIHTT